MSDISAAFKAYDVRGKVPAELDEDLAYQVGLAYAAELAPKGKVATGRDIRDSSPSLQAALNRGLMDGGVDVVDAGLCGTETIYFASFQPGMGGGIMVTASHNPKGYNGLKPVGAMGAPLTGDKGLGALKARIQRGDLPKAARRGALSQHDYTAAVVDHYLKVVPAASLPRLKVVANPGNGCAGRTAKAVLERIGAEVTWVHFEPDQDFPNGVPNPLLPENRASTAKAVLAAKADLGLAWDGDFDRCFFFDAKAEFIEGYYLVGLLAEAVLSANRGAAVVHDPRLFWNTQDIAARCGGRAVVSKTGHAYIKETMRKEDALYGGEMSAHHYFKPFSYCDSGMLPWLMVMQVMKQRKSSLADLMRERQELFPCSGEINFTVTDGPALMRRLRERYAPQASGEEGVDGVSLEFKAGWRFNLRASNTEPLLRLNLESRGNKALMEEKTAEIAGLIKAWS